MTHEPLHSDPSWAPDLPLGDPALVNQPQVIEDRIRSFSAWVLQQAMVADEWTFGSPSAEWLALWLQSNPVWIAERSAYSGRTKEQILKGIMLVLVDYQRQALDGKTAATRRQADEKVHETILFRGIPVAIEFPEGSTRKGVDPQGVSWERTMVHDYGHFTGIPAVDGDSLDCYIGPDETSDLVFVVDQWKSDGSLDEYKTMLGFTTAEEALKGYLAHMPSDWTSYGSLQSMSLKEFRDEWLQTPNVWAAKIARRRALAVAPEKHLEPWVSTEGDKAVAHLGDAEATVLVQPDKARGIIDNIWVPADLRSSGVGTMLMLALAEWCKEHGILYLTGLDVSDNRESAKIRKKLPGKSVLFRRNTENQPGETGADVFPDAPEALKNILKHFIPDESGAVMVTKLARALRASLVAAPLSGAQFNAELKAALGQTEHLKQAGGDEGPELGDHGASSDESGKFWGSAGSGCVIVAKSTGRMLLSYRSEFVNEPHTWGVWGGAIDAGEDPKDSAARELREETGYTGEANLVEAYVFEDGDFRYTTYIAHVPEEFMPKLNWEAEGYQWCRIGEYPDPLHFGLKEALPAIESKLGESDDEEPKGKTSSATYTIPPRIAKATSAPGGLASASQWTTKVWLGNSGTKDHTEVTLVAFDPATATVVPIAGSDEHKGGWELINYLVSRKIIPDLPYVVIALGVNFVNTSDPKEVAQCLAAWTAWRRLQGVNTAVRSRYAQDGHGFLVSMDDFIQAEGNPRKTMVPGKLSAPGERLIKALDALSTLYSKRHLKGIVPEKLLVRAGSNLMEALNHIQYAYILGYQDLQHAKAALSDMEAGGDPAEFERAIFTANGLKNQIHNALRSYGSNQFKDVDLRDTFGDVALAKSEFDRMGAAPASRQASEPDAIDLPEIKWSMPTDDELLNEVCTEYLVEKLFIWETWPKPGDYARAVQDLKHFAKPEQLDPMALEGRHLWRSYEDLKRTVTNFGGPKDPDGMLEAIHAGKPLPMPVVVRHRNGAMEVAGGNTRSGIAALAGQPVTALVINEDAALKAMAERMIADTRARWAEEPELVAAIEAYYLHGGPKPEITSEQGLAAYTLSADFGLIARTLGLDSEGQDIRLRPTLTEALQRQTSARTSAWKFQQIVAARFHGRKSAADEEDAPGPSGYYDKTIQVLKEGIPTFDGFVAKLRTSLQDQFSDYLRAAGGYTGLRRIWDLTLGDQEEDHKRSLNDMRISPRRPWAKEAPNGKEREIPLDDPFGEERLQPDLASVSRSPEKLVKNVSLMETYPNFQGLAGTQMDAPQKAEAIITQMADNLIWLYNHWSPDFRNHTKLWYVGGNRLAHRWAERFKVDPHKVAAVIATLSPQQPWFQNITLAERVLSAVTEHPDLPWDPAMTKLIKTRDWGRKATLGRTSPLHMLKELEGKSLRDLKAEGTPESLYKQAVWIRAWDEAHNPNRLRKCTPDGEFGNWDTNDNGALSKVQWKSFDMIGKAIQAVESSSIQEISEVVGEGHKVRSFYNNLVAPHSDGGDVTIDTHAVAAALLRPLSASSREVSHNFGSNVTGEPGPAADSEAGVKGTYGFYAEAYRRAAKELGVLPRELQSITWEAVRGLFEVKIKGTNGEKTQGAIQKTWEDVSRGKLNAATARERISALAGGITAPGWAHADDADVDLPRDSSYTGELSGDVRPGSGPGGLPSGTGGGTPGRAASLQSRLFRRA